MEEFLSTIGLDGDCAEYAQALAAAGFVGPASLMQRDITMQELLSFGIDSFEDIKSIYFVLHPEDALAAGEMHLYEVSKTLAAWAEPVADDESYASGLLPDVEADMEEDAAYLEAKHKLEQMKAEYAKLVNNETEHSGFEEDEGDDLPLDDEDGALLPDMLADPADVEDAELEAMKLEFEQLKAKAALSDLSLSPDDEAPEQVENIPKAESPKPQKQVKELPRPPSKSGRDQAQSTSLARSNTDSVSPRTKSEGVRGLPLRSNTTPASPASTVPTNSKPAATTRTNGTVAVQAPADPSKRASTMVTQLQALKALQVTGMPKFGNEIKIEVSDPITVTKGQNERTVYLITLVTNLRQFSHLTFHKLEVRRTYSHFDALYKQLVAASSFPLPKFPKKEALGRFNKNIIGERLQYFQLLMDHIAKDVGLRSLTCVVDFFDDSKQFDSQEKKHFSAAKVEAAISGEKTGGGVKLKKVAGKLGLKKSISSKKKDKS